MSPVQRVLLVLLVLSAVPAVAGPLGDAVGSLQGEFTNTISVGSAFVGGLVTVGGGMRAAWLAAHGRDWTTALTQAVFGAAIVAAAAI